MRRSVLIVGGGPAGLSAAEVLAQAGWSVTVAEALGSPLRKFLRAGVGGLNLTHSQPREAFLDAYGASRPALEPFLGRFGPPELRTWAEDLGIPLFTGTSGRIFPVGMAAGPLAAAWLDRLVRQGVTIETGTRWTGWGTERTFDAVVLALGGPTWPALGTGGTWAGLLESRGVVLSPWKPANVGFTVSWTPVFRQRFAGCPLKDVALEGRKGELMITPWGLEGGLLYAAGAKLRNTADAEGRTAITLDLAPGRDRARVEADLSRPREGRSLATHLTRTLRWDKAKIGLLREVLAPGRSPDDPPTLARLVKAFPLVLTGPRPLEEAISAAGGVRWDELTPDLQLKKVPGVWCAGEMIDWEAPTGGYLLTACFSLGRAVGKAVAEAGTKSGPVGVTLSVTTETKSEHP